MSTVAFISFNYNNDEQKKYSGLVRHQNNIYYPIKTISHENITKLISNHQIIRQKLTKMRDENDNVLMLFLDNQYQLYRAVVSHDSKNKTINAPKSFIALEKEDLPNIKYTVTFAIIQPKIISLKGKIKEYGGKLEKATNILYIGRSQTMGGWNLPKSKWCNPFPVKQYGLEKCIQLYDQYVYNDIDLYLSVGELSGKTLACWCHPSSCHGDILIEFWAELFYK